MPTAGAYFNDGLDVDFRARSENNFPMRLGESEDTRATEYMTLPRSETVYLAPSNFTPPTASAMPPSPAPCCAGPPGP